MPPASTSILRLPALVAIAYFLLLLGIFVSPFYLWGSGLPQLSHMILAAAAGLMLLSALVAWNPAWAAALVFVAYTAAINGIVALVNANPLPLSATAYYAFNLVISVGILTLLHARGLEPALTALYRVLFLVLVLQSAIVVTGLGRTFEMFRATGTFNDPNQLAHWLIWVVVLLVAIGRALRYPVSHSLVALAIALPALALSASRSGILGMSVVIIVVLGLLLARLQKVARRVGPQKVALIAVPSLLLAVFGLGSWEGVGVVKQLSTGLVLFQRFTEVGSFTSFEGRGYDRIWKFPEFLVFGAGESVFERWQDKSWFLLEIHSTFGGILFSYGLFGFSLFGIFLFQVIRQLHSKVNVILLGAPMLYSFATYNLRNSMFWISVTVLLAVGAYLRERPRPPARPEARQRLSPDPIPAVPT